MAAVKHSAIHQLALGGQRQSLLVQLIWLHIQLQGLTRTAIQRAQWLHYLAPSGQIQGGWDNQLEPHRVVNMNGVTGFGLASAVCGLVLEATRREASWLGQHNAIAGWSALVAHCMLANS
jgi:hypothetical protein